MLLVCFTLFVFVSYVHHITKYGYIMIRLFCFFLYCHKHGLTRVSIFNQIHIYDDEIDHVKRNIDCLIAQITQVKIDKMDGWMVGWMDGWIGG